MTPSGFDPDERMTERAVREAVAGASAYWSEQTRGRVSFRVVSVSEWTPSRSGCEDPATLWREALAVAPRAAEPGAHLMVLAPAAAGDESTGCDFGYGSIGTRDSGGSIYVTSLHAPLLAHELGHNLGLGHASALDCATTQDGRGQGSSRQKGCERRDYDDLFDVMGYSGEGFGNGYLGAVGVDRLGVDPGGFVDVRASARGIRLLPIDRIGSGPRFLRVVVPGEPVYYAEVRSGAGRDADVVAGVWNPSMGVRILRADPQEEGGSIELDTSPGGWRYDRALGRGRTFTSVGGHVRITVSAFGAGGARLDVEVDDDVPPRS